MKPNLLPSIFLLIALGRTNAKIPCHLVWVEHSDRIPVPEFILATVEGAAFPKDFIARCWKHKENKYIGGRMEGNQAYISFNGTVSMEGNYEVLTNPNLCQTRWSSLGDMEDGDDAYKFHVDDTVEDQDVTYVGRAIVKNRLIAGDVHSGVLHVVRDADTAEEVEEFQYLLSFSYGLQLEMAKFELLNDDVPAKSDVLGVDQIFNQADAEVRQWVYFSKRIREYTKVDSMRSWGKLSTLKITADFSLKVGVDDLALSIPVGQVGFMHGSENGEFKNSSVTRETERLIEVTREVVVPPLTNVLVTSTMVLKENFESKYVAEGVYFSPGLSADEVEQILAEDGIVGVKDTTRNAVIVVMHGIIAGSLSLNNKFLIEPI